MIGVNFPSLIIEMNFDLEIKDRESYYRPPPGVIVFLQGGCQLSILNGFLVKLLIRWALQKIYR